MPRHDGTLWPHERAQINVAQKLYNKSVDAVKMHPNSARIYEAEEKKAFAHLMTVSTRFAGCRY